MHRKKSKGVRDLSEDSFLQTEDQHDEIEDISLKKKRRCCLCCKKWFAVKDLRLALLDFGQQSAIDKNLAKLLESGKSLVDKNVERGSLVDLKQYHERLDFSQKATMPEHRKRAKIKVIPPDLKKNPVKNYATAPNVKKFGLSNVTSKTFSKLKVDKSTSLDQAFSDVTVTNRVLNFLVGSRHRMSKASVVLVPSSENKPNLKNKLLSLFNRPQEGRNSDVSETSSIYGSLLEYKRSNSIERAPSSKGSLLSVKSKTNGEVTSLQQKSPSQTRRMSRSPRQSQVDSTPTPPISRIHMLPQISRQTMMKNRMARLEDDSRRRIVKQFETNWGLTSRHCINWLQNYQKHTFSKADRKTLDRWLVILYSDSGETDEWLRFCSVFIKQVFALNQVPFQERDLEIKSDEFEGDLKTKLGRHSKVDTPLVFISGLKLGGGEAMYYLHKTNRVKETCRKYVIKSKKSYDDWAYKDFHKHQMEELHINVPLQFYPSLEAVSQGMKAKLDQRGKTDIQDGKEYVKLSKLKWKDSSGQPYTDMNWAKYAMLQAHVRSLFQIMDRIFWCTFFPDKKNVYYALPWQRMAGEIRKRIPARQSIIEKLKL